MMEIHGGGSRAVHATNTCWESNFQRSHPHHDRPNRRLSNFHNLSQKKKTTDPQNDGSGVKSGVERCKANRQRRGSHQLTPSDYNAKELAQLRSNMAEHEVSLLGFPEGYERLRSFSVGKKGDLVDCGVCFRSATTAPSSPHKMEGKPGCPDIWLTVADPTISHDPENEIQIWFTGDEGVGKSTLVDHIHGLAQSSTKSVGNDESYEEQGMYSCRILLDSQEVVLNFREVTTDEVEYLTKKSKINIYLVMYSIASKASFRKAAETLFYLSEDLKDPACLSAAILIGSKEDLQRKRRIKKAEYQGLSHVYGVEALEVSPLLGIHTDTLLNSILTQITNLRARSLILKGSDSEQELLFKGRQRPRAKSEIVIPGLNGRVSVLSLISEDELESLNRARRGSLFDRIKDSGSKFARSCECIVTFGRKTKPSFD